MQACGQVGMHFWYALQFEVSDQEYAKINRLQTSPFLNFQQVQTWKCATNSDLFFEEYGLNLLSRQENLPPQAAR